MGTAKAKALGVPKSECMGPCQGDAREKECGGAGRLLAYAFTCDRADTGVAAREQRQQEKERVESSHNPSLSYSMRIDLVGA